MNLVGKLYQPFVLERIEATDWEKGNWSPLVVELDPTAACDLACPGCISEDLVALGNRFSDARLMALGREFIASGVKAVVLIGGGEPLAHRRIGDLIELLGSNDVHVGITTNGSLIDRYLEPIAAYSEWTRVSMDAASAELFNRLRPSRGGKSKFAGILANMRRLAEVKTGKLGYSYLIRTEADGPGIVNNIDEIYDAALLARDMGCDYFEIKPSYRFRGGVPHALMKHDKGLMDKARIQIERLDALATDEFRILKAINLEDSLDGVAADQPKQYKTCPSAHLRTTITPFGAYICPYWRGKEPMRIGDVNESRLIDMWQAPGRSEVMKRLNPARDCGFHCLRHETNLACFDIKEQQRKGEKIAAVDEFDRFI